MCMCNTTLKRPQTAEPPVPARRPSLPTVAGHIVQRALQRLEPREALPPLLPAQERAWAASLQRTRGNQATAELLGRADQEGALARTGAPAPTPSVLGVADLHRAAAFGVSGSPEALPHLGRIQQAFGRYGSPIRDVKAYIDGPAAAASDALGAVAYARGSAVAFRTAPDLFTAAHEAAHIVQQQRGVTLEGGIGSIGDPYEGQADRVASAVVSGRSAEALLGETLGPRAAGSAPRVQLRGVRSAVSGALNAASEA